MDQQEKDLMREIFEVDCQARETYFTRGRTCPIAGLYTVLHPEAPEEYVKGDLLGEDGQREVMAVFGLSAEELDEIVFVNDAPPKGIRDSVKQRRARVIGMLDSFPVEE